ncbi:MAG: CXXX repeat peptide maturase [Bacteroidetes bacterium]|nr:CXXX repeat peptide maturase [Bacteroidota bacterium]
MLKYLIIILNDASVSFCHYESAKTGKKEAGMISYDNLNKAVAFALKNNLKVNFLYPRFRPGKKYEKLIEDVEHVKIVPRKLGGVYSDAITVLEAGDLRKENKVTGTENIILRLSSPELKILPAAVKEIARKGGRINLVIKDVENFGDSKISEYRKLLAEISGLLIKKSGENSIPEVNFLTDRLMLESMNNCDAGITHLTVAPDGRLYLCPAFYYESGENSIGEIRNEINIKNRQLLELKYSPVCRICDAYQCRRCVFLNWKLTGELNTPSRQQCRMSHAEREASGNMLEELKKKNFKGAKGIEIKKLGYDDPFEIAVKNRYSIQEFKNFNS